MPDDLRDHYLRALLLLRDMFDALALDHLEDAPATVPLRIPVDLLLAWRTRAAALPLEEAGQVWLSELSRKKRSATPVEIATGVALIADERRRQVDVEGFTAQHDAQHTGGELVRAAGVYLRLLDVFRWPWDDSSPTFDEDDDVPQLVRAGALIAAQIDRLHTARVLAVGAEVTTVEQLDSLPVDAVIASNYQRRVAKRVASTALISPWSLTGVPGVLSAPDHVKLLPARVLALPS